MAKDKISPGMQQYLDVKKDYPDAFLLFRMGDFSDGWCSLSFSPTIH